MLVEIKNNHFIYMYIIIILLSTHNYLQKNTIQLQNCIYISFKTLFEIKNMKIVREKDKHQVYVENL